MKKNLIVKQDGFKECGAASLLSIIRYYHGNISINKLVELTNTDKSGTNFYNLKMAADVIGLEANGYYVEQFNSLREIHKPFICQLVDQNYEHFVVVYEVKKTKVVVMDPAIGNRVLSIEEFTTLWTGYILIFSPIRSLICYQEKKYLNKIIIDVICKNKVIVFNTLLLSIIYTLFSCLYALYFQSMLEYGLTTTKDNLAILTFVFGTFLLIKCLANFFRNELLIYLNQKLDCSIFLDTFKRLLLLPYNYYKNKTTGEIVSRINDLIYVKNILNKLILTVFLDILIVLISGIILVMIKPILFLFIVVIILIYLLIFSIFRPIVKRYTNKNQQNNAKVNSYLVELINGFETIKNTSTESIMNQKMEQLYINSLNDSFIYDNVSNLELFMKELTSLMGILLIEFLGFSLIVNNVLSLGEFITFSLFANYFIEPLKNIIDLNKEYFYAENSLNRVNHLLDIDIEDLSTKTNFNITGMVKFHNLSFSYNGEKQILSKINCNINVGDKVIILGNSGSGKSSILKLLLKYYPLQRDMIYIDNIDIQDISISNVRNNIACISQNEILYNDTIKNNITLSRQISDEKFMEVCRITCVDEFVKQMFLGYETKLEENGLNLSGGQRQRIILARTLLKSGKIILIDEGLNAVDVNLERKILKTLFEAYSEKTFIIVSHRVENLDLFEQVIYLENGKLVGKLTYPKETLYD